MEIQVFQRYNKLVAKGFAKPITCGTCGLEYVLRATEDGEPVLQCFTCNVKMQPGYRLYEDAKAVVKEHNI